MWQVVTYGDLLLVTPVLPCTGCVRSGGASLEPWTTMSLRRRWDLHLDNGGGGDEGVRQWAAHVLLPKLSEVMARACPSSALNMGVGACTAPSDAEATSNADEYDIKQPDALATLAAMVRSLPDFPRPGIIFRDIVGLVEKRGGCGCARGCCRRRWASQRW